MDHSSPPGKGRPRQAETDEQIVRATLDLVREQGPGAVSIASVSSRSGVARTTIYRRYRDRRALLAAALQPATSRGRPPEQLTVGERLEWVLMRTEDVFTQGIGLGGVAAVLTDSDPEFSSALRESLDAGLRPVLDQIRADIARDMLAADLDPDLMLNLILGAYLAETLRHGTPSAHWRQETATHLSRLLGAGGQ